MLPEIPLFSKALNKNKFSLEKSISSCCVMGVKTGGEKQTSISFALVMAIGITSSSSEKV